MAFSCSGEGAADKLTQKGDNRALTGRPRLEDAHNAS
jgi:hypothetical protein